MKIYIKNNYEFFFDKYQKHWVLYPIDNNKKRIEWDKYDNPIESKYFNNKIELNNFLNNEKK